MGSGEVAIVALSTMISLKVTFSDGLGGVMKLCLADRLGIYVDAIYANIAQHNGTTLLLTSTSCASCCLPIL